MIIPAAHAQPSVVTGRVTSEQGAGIGHATVFIAALHVTARTDEQGHYRMVVPAAAVTTVPRLLQARAIGFRPASREVDLARGPWIQNFVLSGDPNRLQEIVVVGAVTATPRRLLPFAVTTLHASDMPVLATNPLSQLQGRLPGSQIVQPSGRPGAPPAVLLRGPKSLDASGRSQGPLVIVDGAIVNGGLQEINAADIETFEVVRGAAAASKYGSRAGAGVIEITTRSAGDQRGGVTVRSEFGFRNTPSGNATATRHFLVMNETEQRFCIAVAGLPSCSRTVDFQDEVRRINDVPDAVALAPYQFIRDFGSLSGGTAPTSGELKGVFQVNRWPVSWNPAAQIFTDGRHASLSADITSEPGGTRYFGSLSSLVEEGAVRFLRGYRRETARLNADHVTALGPVISGRVLVARATQYPAWGEGPSRTGEFGIESENFLLATRTLPGTNLLARDRWRRLYIRTNPLAQGRPNYNPLYDFENVHGDNAIDRSVVSLQLRHALAPWLRVEATGSGDRRDVAAELFRDRGYRTTIENATFWWGDGMIDQRTSQDASWNLAAGAEMTFSSGSDWRVTATARSVHEWQDVRASRGYGEVMSVAGVRSLANASANIAVASERQSYRAIGMLAGAQVEWRDRYLVDALWRYDGSSLFGPSERWHPYARGSLAWRISDEGFWPWRDAINDVKLRLSVGTAGARPAFAAQYETLASVRGVVQARTLGNERLKPETTRETEVGVDAELLRRVGVSATYAKDITSDQILPVPTPAATGYPAQWINAGTITGSTWEVSVRVPIVERPSFTWTAQVSWDRHRSRITALGRDPFFLTITSRGTGANGTRLYYAAGEEVGTIWGWQYVTDCGQLPAPFAGQCGRGREWQINDQGYVVWVGAGYQPDQGITHNLWQAVRPACVRGATVLSAIGEVNCSGQSGTVHSPWGVPAHWGMPTVMRDSTGRALMRRLGNTMPAFRVSVSHAVQWRRISGHVLLDVARGNRVFNMERQWSLLDFRGREVDQDGRTVASAKPIGYYWRASQPEAGGVGGLYGTLVPTNHTVEDGSYAKLRELSLSLDVGRVGRLGRWSIVLAGRNVHTWTRYRGRDPEVGVGGGPPNSAALVGASVGQYPPTRAFTVSVGSRF